MGLDDWDGCKEDVEAAEKKKKEKVSINIMVPKIVSNLCLCMFKFELLLTSEKYLALMCPQNQDYSLHEGISKG